MNQGCKPYFSCGATGTTVLSKVNLPICRNSKKNVMRGGGGGGGGGNVLK